MFVIFFTLFLERACQTFSPHCPSCFMEGRERTIQDWDHASLSQRTLIVFALQSKGCPSLVRDPDSVLLANSTAEKLRGYPRARHDPRHGMDRLILIRALLPAHTSFALILGDLSHTSQALPNSSVEIAFSERRAL